MVSPQARREAVSLLMAEREFGVTCACGLKLSFIRPGKPIENAYIESFNGKFQDECMNEHWFVTMAQAKRIIEAWRIEYKTERAHSSIGNITPEEYAAGLSKRAEERASLTADSESGRD